jgi:hypothetical protein
MRVRFGRLQARLAILVLGSLLTAATVQAQTFPLTATVRFETGLRKLATITLKDQAIVDWGDGNANIGLLVDCRGFLNQTCDVYGTHRYTTLGIFPVTISYTPPGPFSSPTSVATTATVVPLGDFVVLSIGDSVASGEGNPVVGRSRVSDDPAVINKGLWDDPGSNYPTNDNECHRTVSAGPAMATGFLESTNPSSGITFLHVACSGAKINAGPVQSILNQLRNARRNLENARLLAGGVADGDPINVDVLLISAGGNNIAGGFGNIVTSCVALDDCSEDAATINTINDSFDALPLAYQQLANEINTPTENTRGTVSDVYIAEYYDPTRDETGEFPTIASCPLGGLRQSEWMFLYNSVVAPLNANIALAAATHGWHLVDGIAAAFRTHGYCAPAASRWVLSVADSLQVQGEQLGTAHPNLPGHQSYSSHIRDSIIFFTPPQTTASAFTGGLPYTFGDWTAHDVVVSLMAVNPIGQSGVEKTYVAIDDPTCTPQSLATCTVYTTPIVISASGTHTVSFFSENRSGVAEPMKTVIVRIDKDPPKMTCTASPSVLWAPNGKLIPISTSVTAVDDVSGAAPFVLLSTATSEGSASNDIQDFLTGTADTEGVLRAIRFGTGPGRQYSLTYQSADALGNVGTCTATVVVPHDQRRDPR